MMKTIWETIWDKFVGWFYPHFWRNNAIIFVVVAVLVVIARGR